MTRKCFIVQMALMGFRFKTYFTVMIFDRLLKIVNVDKLDVKLIVVMFNFCQFVFREWAACQLLKFLFALSKFVTECAQCISPGVTLSGKLRDVCLNHGIYI